MAAPPQTNDDMYTINVKADVITFGSEEYYRALEIAQANPELLAELTDSEKLRETVEELQADVETLD